MTTPTPWQQATSQAISSGPWYGGSNSADVLQMQLNAAQSRLKAQQANLKLLQQQKSKLKQPNPKDFGAMARYRHQLASIDRSIKSATGSIAGLQKQIPTIQNKYWEVSGQWDKLLTGANRDSFMALKSLFDSYGLGTLADKIYQYTKNGYSADTISLLLQDTDEYKQRFAGNEARKKAGLPVLSPADYLSTEASYQQIMRQAGMPAGFYDQNSDFANFIGQNVSPSELQSRVDMASQATTLADPAYRSALNQMGIDNAHMTAYFLDPTKAMPYLQKAAATAQIGAEALRNNLAFDQSYAEQLATMGYSAQQAREGYQQIAGELDTLKSLGSMYGTDWNQRMSEASTFGTSPDATKAKAGLLGREQGAFSGAAGGAQAGLGQSKSPTSG